MTEGQMISNEISNINANCSDYNVRAKAWGIIDGFSKQKKQIKYTRNVQDPEIFDKKIESDIDSAKLKSKSWNTLDTYIKWNYIECFLIEKQIQDKEKILSFKTALQKQLINNVVFDNKLKKIIKLNFKDI
jgi:hypothetical protein